jgi:hypothetical protein
MPETSTLVGKKLSRTTYDANGNPVLIFGIAEAVIPSDKPGQVYVVVRRVDAVQEKDNGILRNWPLNIPTEPDEVVKVVD